MQSRQNLQCYTIGHSNHNIDVFINILKKHNINCIVDVRSAPYSEYAPQFNRKTLKQELINHNIFYIYMGDQLGGRYAATDLLFPNGTVNYSKVRQTKPFQEGIKRLIKGIKDGYKMSLMCTEKDPIDCHRSVLISHELIKKGVPINHILYDGKIMSNNELEEILLKKYKPHHADLNLFESMKLREESLEEAYEQRNKDIAYTYKGKESFK